MSELSEIMQVFQNYLNTMFTGTNCLSAVETATSPTSATIVYNTPTSFDVSILEKINRLTELHDPENIDIQQIQYLANTLGYNVNINRGEIGTYLAEDDGVVSASNLDKYLRFIVLSLPHWYKIKTTENSIKLLLFSFGIIADISYYYTDSYLPESQGGKWIVSDYQMLSQSISDIPNKYYPTPHFIIWQDLDLSDGDLQWDLDKRVQIINAINSVKPINTVFRKIGAYVKREKNLYVTGHTRWANYIKIPSNGDSDHWNT